VTTLFARSCLQAGFHQEYAVIPRRRFGVKAVRPEPSSVKSGNSRGVGIVAIYTRRIIPSRDDPPRHFSLVRPHEDDVMQLTNHLSAGILYWRDGALSARVREPQQDGGGCVETIEMGD